MSRPRGRGDAADNWLRDAITGGHVLGYLDLGLPERAAVQRRIRAGLGHTDPAVRGLAWRAAEAVVVAEMETSPCSAHLTAELCAVHERGLTLEEDAPVPGCTCYACSGRMPAPLHEPDLGAVICPWCSGYRHLARDPASVFYVCESCRTRSAVAWPLASVGTMLRDLPRVPRTTRRRPQQREPVNIDRARAVPILDVARRLGLEVNRFGWARCPFHGDTRPSLHLNTRKNTAFCNPCGRSWDSIALYRELRGLGFVEAVRELAA